MKQNRFLIIAVCFFLVGLLSGALMYHQLEGMIPQIMEGVFRGIVVPTSKSATALNIIIRNSTATLVLILTGVTVTGPFLIVYFNGFFSGIGIRYVLERGLPVSTIIKGIAPHGVIELAAFFWAASLGLQLGFSVVKCLLNRSFTEAKVVLKESLATYVKFILPVVIIAGLIEAYVSATLIGATI